MNAKKLRIAMLGMIPGNGHPYSWSAIVNGYNPEEMAKCPYPAIANYLGEQPLENVGIPNAQVTHIWTDNPMDAPLVAAASKIPHVVKNMEDVIGEVDLVIIATDDGTDHVRRARPFVEADIPVFVDKPLAITREELRQFIAWKNAGAKILSSSGLRYADDLKKIERREWLWLNSITCKTWERYGIHALEPLFKVVGPGFTHVRNESKADSSIVYCDHKCGVQLTVCAFKDAIGSREVINAYGCEKHECLTTIHKTYHVFRNQLLSIVEWGITGVDPYPFEETLELMAIIIAGIDSRKQNGALVSVESVFATL